MQPPSILPGGPATREHPAGVKAGAPLTRLEDVVGALALVDDDLKASEEQLTKLIHSDVAAVPAVGGYLVDAGGKRLRPALTALGAMVCGGHDRLHELMCVGELIHLGSLLHDDVVDDGSRRRGRDATHRVYGNAVTVLTGDFCLARAVWLAAEAGGHGTVTALARAVTEMAEGEVLQLQRAGDLDCTYEDYLDVVERKSAALISWCAAASAWDADIATAEALAGYGRAVGVAFQITDDVIDYRTGTGKVPGADLRERKVTLPLLLAMEHTPDIRERLKMGSPTDAEVIQLIADITASGALSNALDAAHGFVEDGLLALNTLPDSDGRRALEVLGRYLVERAI
jgi:octaprenyl-diphosphate synthase